MAEKPLILAVETSGRLGSVALALEECLLAEATFSGLMKHSAELFPAIRDLLGRFNRRPEEIGHIYISVGPGSFTGLRIAVTMAKAMHLANAAKIVAVDTMDVIAANGVDLNSLSIEHRASSHEKIATILDAKRGQFYIAVYEKRLNAENAKNAEKENELEFNSATSAVKGWKKIHPDSLMTANEFLEKFACKEKPVWLLGEGLVYHRDEFKADDICFFDEGYWYPKASKVHLLGWQLALANRFSDPLLLTPNYLMRPGITLKRKRR